MKRFMSVLFIALLSVSVLAGCNNAVDTDTNNSDDSLTTVAAAINSSKTTTKASSGSSKTPTTQQLVKGYFDVISHFENGSAGTSLKLAKTATEVLQFCQSYDVSDCDISALRDNMLNAWEKVLDDEDRANFDENFMDVVDFLDTAEENPSEVAGQLEDAGVADTFNKLVKQSDTWDNWDTLKAHTLTMGNSEE